MVFLDPLTEKDKRSLRIAYLASELLLKVKSGPISIANIWGTERESERLKAFRREELDEAFEKLLYWTADGPLVRLRQGQHEWYEATSIGRDMTVAELVFKLIDPQYHKSKDAVRNEKKWDRARGSCVFLAAISAMFVFGIQFIYLPPQGGPLTLEPIPVKIAVGAFFSFLALGFVLAYLGRKQWVSHETDVAVSLYDAYSRYKNFIADSGKKRSSKEAQTLVKRATELLNIANSGSLWATVSPQLEEIADIGLQLKDKVLPAMQDHISSRKIGDVLVSLARCFMESKEKSLEIAKQRLGDMETIRAQPGFLDKLTTNWGSYSHAHPYLVGSAISLGLVLIAYVTWVSWISPATIVPSAIIMLTMLGAIAAFATLIGQALKR
jgi:hypothetical protein